MDKILKEDFKAILEKSPNPIVILNFSQYKIRNWEEIFYSRDELKNKIADIILFANKAYFSLIQVQNIDEVIKYWAKDFNFENYPNFNELIKENYKDKSGFSFENIIHLESGDMKYSRVYVSFPKDKNNDVLILTYQDITELKINKSNINYHLKLDEALFKISKISIKTISKIKYFEKITQIIYNTYKVNFVAIFELDSSSQNLNLFYGIGWKEKEIGKLHSFNHSKSLYEDTLNKDRAIVLNNFELNDLLYLPKLLLRYNIKSGITIRIKQKKKIYGILTVFSTVIHNYSKEEIKLLESIANIIGLTLDRLDFENRLHNSIEICHHLYNEAPDLFLSVNISDTKIINCNQKTVESVGYSKKEILEKSIFDLYHPISMKLAKKSFDLFIKLGKLVNQELIVMKKNGESLDVSMNISSIRDHKGKITEGIIIWRIITDRKEKERKIINQSKKILRHNKALKMYLDSNLIIMNSKNENELLNNICKSVASDGNYEFAWIGYCSKGLKKIIKPITSSNNEIYLKEDLEINYDDSINGNDNIGTSIKTMRPSIEIYNNQENTHLVKTDNEIISSITLPLIIDEKAIGVLSLYSSTQISYDKQEIKLLINLAETLSFAINSHKTKKQRNELQKRLQKDEMEIIKLLVGIEKGSSIVIITDKEGYIEYINSAFTIITGYTIFDVKGKSPRILKSNKHDNEIYKNLWDTIITGNTWTGTLINKKKNGDLFTVIVSINPIFDEKHEIINFVGIQQDITEIQRIQDKVVKSQKMEAIGRLSRNISHEFKNILSIISLNIDLIEQLSKDNESIDNEIEGIKNTIMKATAITSMLVNFTKDQNDGDNQEFSPKKQMEDLFQWLTPVLGKMIKIEVIYCNSNIKLIGNPEKFNQMIVNLVMNSKDAMPNGGKIIIHSTVISIINGEIISDLRYSDKNIVKSMIPEKLRDNEDLFFIKVEDNGIGMKKQVMDRVFEPFWTTKINGNGIGLSVIYGYVQSSNGFITVTSEYGKGTSFLILLPIDKISKIK